MSATNSYKQLRNFYQNVIRTTKRTVTTATASGTVITATTTNNNLIDLKLRRYLKKVYHRMIDWIKIRENAATINAAATATATATATDTATTATITTTTATTSATSSTRWLILSLLFIVYLSTDINNCVTATSSKEAYFNGSAYLRLLSPMPVWDHSAISFRSCRGGEILAQQYNKNSIVISVLNEFLQISLAGPGVIGPNNRVDVKYSYHLLDNRWHTIQFKYEYGNLYLYIDRESRIFANSTFNSQFLTNKDIGNEAAILILGNSFTGCLQDGPGLQFINDSMTVQNAVFGVCPLSHSPCGDQDTQLKIQNYCSNDPCMGHGTCDSLTHGYECHCTARYSGKNCQKDNGPPCERLPCANGGTCSEDNHGDYYCTCLPTHTGKHCETEINVNPLCHINPNPCLNGGACVVAAGSSNIECECPKGYAGNRCEINMDDCISNPCQNNGKCIDMVNSFVCDCTGTGFIGTLCQNNIDECELKPCQNAGQCFDTYGWFICQCMDGWAGDLCEKPISCQTQQCLNGGTCVDKSIGFQCICPPNYSGELCQQGPPPCSQCPLDAECIAGKCVCKAGTTALTNVSDRNFDGHELSTISFMAGRKGKRYIPPEWLKKKRCELKLSAIGHCVPMTPITIAPTLTTRYPSTSPVPPVVVNAVQQSRSAQLNACSSDKCLNGGTCQGYATNYTCICASGYKGFNCEQSITDSSTAALNGNGCKCLNGGTCSLNGTQCYCPVNYFGERCEKLEPCTLANCQEPMICVQNKCICPENKVCNTCATQPCRNNGICIDSDNGDYECKCPAGWKGRNCTKDVDECSISPKICGNGICKNEEGSYKCYCTPGFTGIHCDSDVDECLSHPCKNGATCHNKINAYECACVPGYKGVNCEIDINECASNPCSAGSTCIDLINDFNCSCIAGMTGRTCEIDIDDCVSNPCHHNGRCIDELGGFHCDCTGTGYDGDYCQSNIDECITNPCHNGAQCIDQINDYSCNCHQGYGGKNCEIDINECENNPCQYNGICLERSNKTLYTLSLSHDLPSIFNHPFSYENASGYECVCVDGIIGKNCEININECESNPCSKHGTCNDGIGSFTCECDPGFEGKFCDVNIDECERYTPCGDHGTCIDQINDYDCDCDAMFGGKNCSVPLIGCANGPCLNDGLCKPYLINETIHLFNCSCRHGFQGKTCQKTTTISMAFSSLITVKTQRDEGYDINLQFRTTLPNGVLAFGTSGAQNEPVSYILELINGRLNLHSSLLNKWEGVFIGSNLNDSNWHKVFVAINTSHLVLSANDEQAIFPVGYYETSNGSQQPPFPLTYLGGTIPNLKSYLRHLTHQPSSFVGCMQDIVVNGKWIFPEERDLDNNTNLTHIQSGCPRTEQCYPNPCHSNGKCTDLWHTFSCTCQRPHFGHTCKHNVTAATFGNENTSHSAVIVDTNEAARRAIRSILDISMFIRTRQPTGQVFYLGSDSRKAPSKGTDIGSSYVAAKLQGGELLVKMQFNGTPEAYTVGGNKLDNGYNHLIEVVRNQTLVQVKLNGTEYFRKTLSSTGLLDAQVLYLGGPAPTPITPSAYNSVTTVPESEIPTEYMAIKPEDYFKGIIQDVKVSNGSHTMIVELYPLEEGNLDLPPPFGTITMDRTSVLKGEVSDDLCRKNPCKHNAECTNTWNDYTCSCPNGYKGKDCQEIEFCQLVTCPGDSICQNLDDGYECLTEITFRGDEKAPLIFTLHHEQLIEETVLKISPLIEIAYRTRTGGTLLYVENHDNFFEIGVNQGQVTVTWKLGNQDPLGDTKRFNKENVTGTDWSRIYLRAQNGKLEGGWKGWESLVDPSPAFSADINTKAFQDLLSNGPQIYLGGMPNNSHHILGSLSSQQGSQFKGCLGEARIGNLLLPYFNNDEIYKHTANFSVQPKVHFRLNSTQPVEGCTLCFESDCQNGGSCKSPSEDYACACLAGYNGDDCSNDINECESAKCLNNATCIDKVADFYCSCVPGYDGVLCENNIDECASQPCHNDGNCTDLIAAFHCNCTEDYAGPQCDILKQVTCENNPCKNGSTCQNGLNALTGNNFTCTCASGYEGPLCDEAFCERTPCLNGGLCVVNDALQAPMCKCSLGYMGQLCEKDIDECASNPCLNDGRCVNLVGRYLCDCHGTGFEGINCEIDIDECAISAEYCGGLGRCINQPGSFKCICQDSFCGAYCNFTDPCKQSDQNQLCMNGGTCVETCGDEADYYCNCTDGFTGKNCTVLITSKEEPSTADIAIIVAPVIVVLLLIMAALLVTFLVMARNKRATRGTYSPSAQEYCNPRLEMDNVLKPPPEERLI